MSQLDALLARSRESGGFTERRHFTLSREKAIEKQREYALRDPRQYVLELVQAAVFANASYVAVDTRPNTLLVAWVGGKTIGQIDNIFDYLFADRGDAEIRHLIQLAIGLNAILQRQPKILRIESGSPREGSMRMDIDRKGGVTIGVPERPISGTYLFAQFGSAWLPRFESSVTTEHALVEERCMYSPVPILLNNDAPFGYRSCRRLAVFGAKVQEHFDDGGRRGVVALHTNKKVSGFRMVVGGVWISSLPLPELADRPLVGVVCDDSLRKTADQSDIVQDYRYLQMLHAVQPHATKLLHQIQDSYAPPRLPPVKEPIEQEEQAPAPELEPLPHPIARVGGHQMPLEEIKQAGANPVFWVHPDDRDELATPVQPHRFPERVIRLNEGQAATLAHEVPELQLFRLTTPADVDFIRGVKERNKKLRTFKRTIAEGEIELRLHLAGRMPWYGEPPGAIPVVVIHSDRTSFAGGLSSNPFLPEIYLPRLSVVFHSNEPNVGIHLEDRFERFIRDTIFDEVLELTVQKGEPTVRSLLCALLGLMAIPAFVDEEGETKLSASLPHNCPPEVWDTELAATSTGPLTLRRFLSLLGTNDVVELLDKADLRNLRPLEERFGFGHLHHESLDKTPVVAMGLQHGSWQLLPDDAAWSSPSVHQIIWLTSTLKEFAGHHDWMVHEQPFPGVVAACRKGFNPGAWEEGYQALKHNLGGFLTGTNHSSRTKSLVRLALLRLGQMFEDEEVPIFAPSDGGARRSLAELKGSPHTRLVAHGGVETAEPWTFYPTMDEVTAFQTRFRLRYDDDPQVWESLTDAEHPGWLVRHEVQIPGLEGWLGLRHPYDGTGGIIVRTTGHLLSLPAIDSRTPCHGLVWPKDATVGKLTTNQETLLQLAGVQLYQSLLDTLRSSPQG
ncbi:MAG: hypothetical protein HN348_11740, partial [Proteobacteria bacterium]|nr:hypothetical protein [Pseudomonadota bacterium]